MEYSKSELNYAASKEQLKQTLSSIEKNCLENYEIQVSHQKMLEDEEYFLLVINELSLLNDDKLAYLVDSAKELKKATLAALTQPDDVTSNKQLPIAHIAIGFGVVAALAVGYLLFNNQTANAPEQLGPPQTQQIQVVQPNTTVSTPVNTPGTSQSATNKSVPQLKYELTDIQLSDAEQKEAKAPVKFQKVTLSEQFPEKLREVATTHIRAKLKFRFATTSPMTLRNQSEKDLKRLLKYLAQHPEKQITLTSYADGLETEAKNKKRAARQSSFLRSILKQRDIKSIKYKNFASVYPSGLNDENRVEVWIRDKT